MKKVVVPLINKFCSDQGTSQITVIWSEHKCQRRTITAENRREMLSNQIKSCLLRKINTPPSGYSFLSWLNITPADSHYIYVKFSSLGKFSLTVPAFETSLQEISLINLFSNLLTLQDQTKEFSPPVCCNKAARFQRTFEKWSNWRKYEIFRTSTLGEFLSEHLGDPQSINPPPRLRRPSQECLKATAALNCWTSASPWKRMVESFDHFPPQYLHCTVARWEEQPKIDLRQIPSPNLEKYKSKFIWTVCPLSPQKICRFSQVIQPTRATSYYAAIYISFPPWFRNGIGDAVRNKLSGNLWSREVFETFKQLIG